MARPAFASTAICALLLALLGTGCYTGTQAYVRPHATVNTSDAATTLAAVQQVALTHGLRVTRVRPERGEVVAVSTPDNLGGMMLRDRWHFWVLSGQVTVEMHPETQVERDGRVHWQRMTAVCDCYHYAREREMLREIRRRLLGEPQAPAVAAASASGPVF